MKYRIYDRSVRAMLNYSKPDGIRYKTVIDKNAPVKPVDLNEVLRTCRKYAVGDVIEVYGYDEPITIISVTDNDNYKRISYVGLIGDTNNTCTFEHRDITKVYEKKTGKTR